MTEPSDVPRVAMQVSRGVVLASIQVDLDDDVIRQFQEGVLERIHRTGARGVILDVSGLETLDSEEFHALRRIVAMAKIMGAESVIVGLRPGIVSALIESGAEVDGLRATQDLEAAYRVFERRVEPGHEPPGTDAGESAAGPEAEASDAGDPPDRAG